MEIRCDELARMLLPPWLAYPDIPPWSIGWRMGVGEHYLHRWNTWYYALSEQARRAYREHYPPPEEWAPFYRERPV
ncbi:MAG: hypothetical protein OHK0022_53180 [Roseiflexaceae bacterium]